ncbi:hypothetical protein ASG47_09560 [Devosia sp. Leaf420]|uniref:hypothetical protein n=1 Tax=Devosia sp. Leaf420 TaxID=1736374 RepID=UPI000712DB79|nr:hypothetical protein [Devosia sp. Leaf420]KQT48573.1 hypothetical protein ASG47_09560 [Devosia sp. Leaf420]
MRALGIALIFLVFCGGANVKSTEVAASCDFSRIPGPVYTYEMTSGEGEVTLLLIPYEYVASITSGRSRYSLALSALRDNLLPMSASLSSSQIAREAAKSGRILDYQITIYATNSLRARLDAIAWTYGFSINSDEILQAKMDPNGFLTTAERKPSVPKEHPLATDLYWQLNSNGKIVRIVHCHRSGLVPTPYCKHYVQDGSLVIQFDYPLNEQALWRENESSVLSLVGCFKEPSSS